MNKAWVILFVSAATDFIIAAGTALTAAMVAKGDAMLPSYPVLILSIVGGLIAFARTVQQSLRKEESSQTTIQTTVTTPTPIPPKEKP